MASDSEEQKSISARRRVAIVLFRSLASLKLAVVLLVLLAAVLAWATYLEATKGREVAQWYVYRSQWFIALFGLLAVNILAATLKRLSRWRTQFGFVVAHVGVLLLLVGAIQTLLSGIDGKISFAEGETANTIVLTDRSQLKLITREPGDWKSTEFSFCPGPVDWQDGETLDFGAIDGVGLRVLKFYRHARREVNWVADVAEGSRPVIQLAVVDSNQQPIGTYWCVTSAFSRPPTTGAPTFLLQQAHVATMINDFLKPPSLEQLGKLGVLSIHYNDKVYSIAVDENVGKKVDLSKDGLAVEIVKYYANAVVGNGGQFESVGKEAKNPMLELKVHLPDHGASIPEVSYANNPLVNFELMKGQQCPVKFWYHHPATPVAPGAEFLQTPDGKLYCRIGGDNGYEPIGEVQEGDRITFAADREATILQYIPHARREATYRSVPLASGETEGPGAAALVELTIANTTEQFWLKRNDPQHGVHRIESPHGPLRLLFGFEGLPLGFALKLIDFQRGLNPGQMGNASFASLVQLVDKDRGVEESQQISMNEPMTYGKFTFYQASYQVLPDGTEASVLSVAYDPGRFLKYLGSLMICIGILFMFYMKSWFRRRTPNLNAMPQTVDRDGNQRDETSGSGQTSTV